MDTLTTPSTQPSSDRPGIAVLTNVLTPYRVALHQRIVREMPDIRLWTVLTHDTGDQPWSLQADDINVVKFGKGGENVQNTKPFRRAKEHWDKGGRVIKWARENNVRAVLVGGYFDLTRVRVIGWGHRKDVPIFLVSDSNVRSQYAKGFTKTVKHTIVRWVMKRCVGLMPCGSLGAEFFLRRGADPKRIFYVPYEPDYSLIRDMPAAKIAEAKAKMGLKEGRRRLVACSRMIPFKRMDLTVDAFVAIASQRPEWDLVIIGDGPLKADLQARVPAELKDRVTFAGFVGDQSVISGVYRASDVLVHMAGYEPWGLVINEAVCAGMAVLSTDVVGATAELVRDGVNGRVVPADDLPKATEALLDITDPSKIDRYKAASAGVLADWQDRGDPVKGLRKALAFAGVLPASNGSGRR